MEKIDKVINYFRNIREEGMVAGTGGFSSSSDPKGPVAGYDPPMGKMQKRFAKGGRGSRKNWLEYLRNNK